MFDRLGPLGVSFLDGKRNKTKKLFLLELSCHPYAGAMLIFSVSFQFYQMSRTFVRTEGVYSVEKYRYRDVGAGKIG